MFYVHCAYAGPCHRASRTSLVTDDRLKVVTKSADFSMHEMKITLSICRVQLELGHFLFEYVRHFFKI